MASEQNFEPLRVGVIGAGDISTVYLNAIDRSPALRLLAIAARTEESARRRAADYGVTGQSLDALLADDRLELLVNLAPGRDHDAINARVIAAGKHLYTEKPFALSFQVADRLCKMAQDSGVRIASAPDTLLGGGHQKARQMIDAGLIGQPVFGVSMVGHAGVEYYHPNPAAFYQPGAEPPYDIGPYYVTQWVHLLGPVRQVHAASAVGPDRRQIRVGPQAGAHFPVESDTSFLATLTFDQAVVSLIMSLDMADRSLQQNHCYGTAGCLQLPDPNFFGGEPALLPERRVEAPAPVETLPFGRPNHAGHFGDRVADYRGVGLVDLAIALRDGRPHRMDAGLILHVTEILEAIMTSARIGAAMRLTTDCSRPAPIDTQKDAALVAMMQSPWDRE